MSELDFFSRLNELQVFVSEMKGNETVPFFVGNGFLKKEKLRVNLKKAIEIEISFKVMDSDGLLFYLANPEISTEQSIEGDFVALVLIASQLHFFWNVGTTILYSRCFYLQ